MDLISGTSSMGRQTWQLAIALCLMLAGCSYNPFSSDNHLTGKPVGAVIGGTAGAGTAAIAGASRTGVAITGVGGAALGYYFTTREFLSGGIKRAGGDVFVEGDCVTIALPTTSLFDDNSPRLRSDAAPALDSTIAVMNDFPDNNIFISGNSSGFGTQTDEKRMTQLRAQEVAGYLWAHGVSAFQSNGISRRQLTVVGYGHRMPIANSITATGIFENSRIQISSCPCITELKSNIINKTNANIGDGNFKMPDGTDVIAGNFKGDNLPAPADESPGNFRPAFQDKAATSGDLKGVRG